MFMDASLIEPEFKPKPDGGADRPVVLVVPPFFSAVRPALGVSQLKANLAGAGFRVELLYLNLSFAEQVGLYTYERLSQGHFFGDLLFSHELFDRTVYHVRSYLETIERDAGWWRLSPLGQDLGRARSSDKGFLLQYMFDCIHEFCTTTGLKEILCRNPWMVGFTSSFQQNCAALALAKEIKKREPAIRTLIGGANCEGEMGEELLRSFGFMDFVGQGQCDKSLVELVSDLYSGGKGYDIPGILARGDPNPVRSAYSLFRNDLDRLPHPDLSDYFTRLEVSPMARSVAPSLVMETSRGCWWGAKRHCTFCGLNGETMEFRSKSPDRALSEMESLVRKYRRPFVEVVDNILDMEYFKTVLPGMKDKRLGRFFFETKANLTRRHVIELAEAGITIIQPGIESFSDRNLEHMRKGVTALQNIQLLKWCAEAGVSANWIYLYGFPAEDSAELPSIKEIFESVHHLKPPFLAWPLRLDRFSPYFESPEDWGLSPVCPDPAYQQIYSPLSEQAVARLAYYFDSPVLEETRKDPAFEALREWVKEWHLAYPSSHLLAVHRPKYSLLFDTRRCARRALYVLSGRRRSLYRYCLRVRSEMQILSRFRDFSPSLLREDLRSLTDCRLMLGINGRYLGISTDITDRYRAPTDWDHLPYAKDLDSTRKFIPASVHRKAGGVPAVLGSALTAIRRRLASDVTLRVARSCGSIPRISDTAGSVK